MPAPKPLLTMRLPVQEAKQRPCHSDHLGWPGLTLYLSTNLQLPFLLLPTAPIQFMAKKEGRLIGLMCGASSVAWREMLTTALAPQEHTKKGIGFGL